MATDSVVRARIDERVKKEATVVLESIGLSMTDAINMLLIRVAEEGRLPFEPLVPSLETIAAAREARKGGLPRYDTVGDLMADLDAED